MTVGKISIACWTLFVIMSVAFLPVGAAVFIALHGAPAAVRVVAAVVVAGGLWWAPFAYGMYLAMQVVRKGDPRLLKRGIRGTAEVLSRKATNEVIQSGEFAWEAPRVYKYRLRVAIPGTSPYVTDCRICAPGYAEGSTVHVAVSPHNHKRVTIDPGRSGQSVGGRRAGGYATVTAVNDNPRWEEHASASPAADHYDELTKLGQLHRQGVLTDEEFAEQKARILGERQ
jgi:hypothetical protein